MKTIQEQIEVMQHFERGGAIECIARCENDVWETSKNPDWTWSAYDYRIKQPVDPYAELKAAAADPTKQVRIEGFDWRDAGYDWRWDTPAECYEIRDKPKPLKKVKMLAWFDGGSLFWRTENYSYSAYKRVPMQDKVIEVEE